jgi:lactate dehydrogenase-like 2-hydroxyacid dehydrogenase
LSNLSSFDSHTIIGAGYDTIDVNACSSREPPLRVSNVPTAVDDATADTNMFLILGALRNFNMSVLSLREGKWRGNPPPTLGHDPEGKILGIIGMGGIGRNLKKKAEAFGMRVVYHNRRKLSDELAAGAEYVSFDELLTTSDIISLNLPLNVCCSFFSQFLSSGTGGREDEIGFLSSHTVPREQPNTNLVHRNTPII